MTDHLEKAKKFVADGQKEVVQSAIINCELSAIAHALIAVADELRATRTAQQSHNSVMARAAGEW